MESADVSRLKVLIVDDHAVVRKQLDRMLRSFGFNHVDQAETANQAAEKMDACLYEIIFMDWHLPGKSGYNLMQDRRGERKYDGVAFIMISVEADERFIGEAMKAGATAYIVKPPTEAMLESTIAKILKWRGQHYTDATKDAG